MLYYNAMEAIRFEKVNFQYSEESGAVLRNVSFSVDAGEYVCMLGRNGSGKSTVARLINALLLPASGKVTVFGMDTADKAQTFNVRKRVGIVFQNPDNQQVAAIVEDDVAFGPENLGLSREEIGKRIDFALDGANMRKYRYEMADKLSGGQKQRVAVAGMLAMRPDVLILDESTSMLDARGRKEVLGVVKKLNDEGMTVISITHYMDEAADADRIIVLSDGEIVEDGLPDEIFGNTEDLRRYGLELPRAAYIAENLRKRGVPLKSGILTEDVLSEELCKSLLKI